MVFQNLGLQVLKFNLESSHVYVRLFREDILSLTEHLSIDKFDTVFRNFADEILASGLLFEVKQTLQILEIEFFIDHKLGQTLKGTLV